MTAAPGLLHKVMFRLFWHPGERMEPVRIDKPLVDGETLPTAGTPICNGSRRSVWLQPPTLSTAVTPLCYPIPTWSSMLSVPPP